jgi:hypothetical protein
VDFDEEEDDRPVSPKELAILARKRTPAALQRLDEIIQDTKQPREVLAAIKLLFDRAYGKVDRNPLPTADSPVDEMDTLPREKRIEALQRALDIETAELRRELGMLE